MMLAILNLISFITEVCLTCYQLKCSFNGTRCESAFACTKGLIGTTQQKSGLFKRFFNLTTFHTADNLTDIKHMSKIYTILQPRKTC